MSGVDLRATGQTAWSADHCLGLGLREPPDVGRSGRRFLEAFRMDFRMPSRRP